jgi:hypothetical protein
MKKRHARHPCRGEGAKRGAGAVDAARAPPSEQVVAMGFGGLTQGEARRAPEEGRGSVRGSRTTRTPGAAPGHVTAFGHGSALALA